MHVPAEGYRLLCVLSRRKQPVPGQCVTECCPVPAVWLRSHTSFPGLPSASFEIASSRQSVQPCGGRHQEPASSSKHTKGLAQAENSNTLPSFRGGTCCLLGLGDGGASPSDVIFLGQECLYVHTVSPMAPSPGVNPNPASLRASVLVLPWCWGTPVWWNAGVLRRCL